VLYPSSLNHRFDVQPVHKFLLSNGQGPIEDLNSDEAKTSTTN